MNRTWKRLTVSGLMTAIICLLTAYALHIPIGGHGGYVHLGDAAIYLAAALLPAPYAMASAAVGGALADLLTGGVIWAVPTAIIKALAVLPFTARETTLLCRHNRCAAIPAGVIGVVGYGLAAWVLFGSWAATAANILPDLLQETVAGLLFLWSAAMLDRIGFKQRFGV